MPVSTVKCGPLPDCPSADLAMLDIAVKLTVIAQFLDTRVPVIGFRNLGLRIYNKCLRRPRYVDPLFFLGGYRFIQEAGWWSRLRG